LGKKRRKGEEEKRRRGDKKFIYLLESFCPVGKTDKCDLAIIATSIEIIST